MYSRKYYYRLSKKKYKKKIFFLLYLDYHTLPLTLHHNIYIYNIIDKIGVRDEIQHSKKVKGWV